MRLPYKNCETWDTLCMIVGWFSLATAAGAQLIDPLAQLLRWRACRVKRQAANAVAKEVVDVELVDLHGPIHAVFEHERHLFFGHVCVRVVLVPKYRAGAQTTLRVSATETGRDWRGVSRRDIKKPAEAHFKSQRKQKLPLHTVGYVTPSMKLTKLRIAVVLP